MKSGPRPPEASRIARIPVARPAIGPRELEYATEAIRSGWISSLGEYVVRFEEAFASYCGVSHGISTANGTVALHLALRLVGVDAGDEVLVPDLTFIAVPNAVRYLDARPVLVDCSPNTWCMDPVRIEESLSPRTRAIVAVHSYGGVCDMRAILEMAGRRGVAVVEDAAEAHGATYDGRRVGSLGRVGVFSFYGNKIVTTGEGGMLTTNEDALAERARSLKDHGMSRETRYLHPEIGYNYRLTNVQAAIGLAQVERIDHLIAARDAIAKRYRERLAGVPGVVFQEYSAGARGVCWLFSILVTEAHPLGRDRLMDALSRVGIETRPFFVAIHEQPPYRNGGSYPVAARLSREGLNLPTSSDLTTEEVDRVCAAIREVSER